MLLAVPAAEGATRLTYEIGGKPTAIAWEADAFPLRYVVDERLAAVAGGAATVRRGFDAWGSITGSRVSFADSGVRAAAAGRDGLNSVSLSDPLFANSGFIAYATTWFDDRGVMTEADIQIDTAAAGEGKLAALIHHEIGHLLGLDHSAVLSSVMYPWVEDDATILDSDDRLAIAAIYPTSQFPAENALIRGTVRGQRGGVFAAQVVAVDERGSPVSSRLTGSDGTFEMHVPAGRYRLYVEPLNGPVDVRNLSGVWRQADGEDFRTEFFPPGEIDVAGGRTYDGIELRGEGPALLNPKWIGVHAAGANEIRLSSSVSVLRTGSEMAVAVGGDGIVGGLTELEVMSRDVVRVSDFQYGANYVWAIFRVSPTAPATSLVVLVRNGSNEAALTGGLRIINGPPRRRAVR